MNFAIQCGAHAHSNCTIWHHIAVCVYAVSRGYQMAWIWYIHNSMNDNIEAVAARYSINGITVFEGVAVYANSEWVGILQDNGRIDEAPRAYVVFS